MDNTMLVLEVMEITYSLLVFPRLKLETALLSKL
jgi:hypothetical protein